MTELKKVPAGKTAKTTAKAKAPATPKVSKTPKIIRNLRNMPVHLRFFTEAKTDPFRIELQPRGLRGDSERVPAALTETQAFQEGYGVLFEIITSTEQKKIPYGRVGYTGEAAVEIIRDEDINRLVAPDWDGKGRPPHLLQAQGRIGEIAGPVIADLPGSAGGSALPDGVDLTSRRIKIERG